MRFFLKLLILLLLWLFKEELVPKIEVPAPKISPSLLQSLFFSSDYHLPSSPPLANLLFGFTSIIASPLQLLLFFPRPSTFTILCFFILRGISSSASSSPCQETTPPASSLCCAVLLPLASVLQQVTIFFPSSSREQRSSCSVSARFHCWPLMCAIPLWTCGQLARTSKARSPGTEAAPPPFSSSSSVGFAVDSVCCWFLSLFGGCCCWCCFPFRLTVLPSSPEQLQSPQADHLELLDHPSLGINLWLS